MENSPISGAISLDASRARRKEMRYIWPSLLLTLAVSTGPAVAQAPDDASGFLPVPRSSLTAEEQARALRLAKPEGEVASSFMQLDPAAPSLPDRIVPSSVEAVVSDRVDEQLAVVTYYLYNEDVALRRLVDLKTGAIVDERRDQGGNAPVADVEKRYAQALLNSDQRLKDLLAAYQGNVSYGLSLTTTADTASPFYGKRVLYALVRSPEGYVPDLPQIFVNLTDGAVVFE